MARQCVQTPLADSSQWVVNHCAVTATSVPTQARPEDRRVVVLDHPGYPFARTITAPNEAQLIADLKSMTAEYVRRIQTRADLPARWFAALSQAEDVDPNTRFFGWLPIRWGTSAAASPANVDPRQSFWINRYRDPSGAPPQLIERTLVRVAGHAFNGPDGVIRALGSSLGARVAVHVHSTLPNQHLAKIIGFSAIVVASEGAEDRLQAATETLVGDRQFDERTRLELARLLRLNFDSLTLQGVGTDPRVVRLFGSGIDDSARSIHYEFKAEVEIRPGPTLVMRKALRCERTSHATAPGKTIANVFVRDPASAGPATSIRDRRRRRREEQLDAFRVRVSVPGLQPSGPDPAGVRSLQGSPGLFEVRQSPFVDQPAVVPTPIKDRDRPNLGLAEEVASKINFPVRASAIDAAHAYYHGHGFFDRISNFGLSPTEVFKFAKLPLVLRYRASIAPGWGSDGQTVNAQVTPLGNEPDFRKDVPLEQRSQIEVEFALGDLKRRDRPKRDHRDVDRRVPRAAYLGISNDPRWVWHEFSHVLIAAATGTAELPFVHSFGDALGAINADPTSELASEPDWRHVTFPWIGSIRRHDRAVESGWSWSGSFHRATRATPGTLCCDRKAYVSEQILSTTLFRLYRCIGGDTDTLAGTTLSADIETRQAAADYVTYLLMKASALAGPATLVAVETPEQFVQALLQADGELSEWQVTAAWPYEDGKPARNLHRAGGCLHKVIRWAFEAQGLYAAPPPAIVNAPGNPPDPDLYVDDRRPNSGGNHPRGGYMPVSLHWDFLVGKAPDWHATDQAVRYDPMNRQVTISVSNRGATAALLVTVTVWFRDAASQNGPWTKMSLAGGATSPTTVLAGNAVTDYGPFTFDPSPGRYVIVAIADCPADAANRGAPDATAVWSNQKLLTDLVANDNNIGLRIIDVT